MKKTKNKKKEEKEFLLGENLKFFAFMEEYREKIE